VHARPGWPASSPTRPCRAQRVLPAPRRRLAPLHQPSAPPPSPYQTPRLNSAAVPHYSASPHLRRWRGGETPCYPYAGRGEKASCARQWRREVIERRAERCEYLQFEGLRAWPEVAHAVFTRRGGYSAAPFDGLNLSVSTGDDLTTVRRNRQSLRNALGLPLVHAFPSPGSAVALFGPSVG